MKGGGSISGQWISDAAKLGKISDALRGLGGKERFLGRYAVPSDRAESLKPLLFAVGDGNHSLATAKAYWEKQKAAGAGDDHPARFALVQLQNLHDPALEFEPIHRLLFNVKAEEFLADAAKWFSEQGEGALQKHKGKTLAEVPGHCVEYRSAGHTGVMELTTPSRVLPVASLTAFVDQWLAAHSEAKIDYVHGLEVIDRHVADTPRHSGSHPPRDAEGRSLQDRRSGRRPAKEDLFHGRGRREALLLRGQGHPCMRRVRLCTYPHPHRPWR